ncbi:MAG: hypothetical protein AB7P12_06835 [Alphaproteobacteria bacterium]
MMATAQKEPGRAPHDSDMHRRRRGRNLALLVVLGALVVLFYVITIVKMSGGG